MAKSSTASAAGKPKRGRKSEKPTFIEQERRKQILQVSAELFRLKGFDSTSVEDIAQAAGVSRGVIFYYFDGKRDIGAQTATQSLKQYSEYVRERVEGHSNSRDQLLEFVAACLDYQRDHREVYLLYIDLIGCFGDAGDKYSLTVSMNRRTRELLAEMIRRGQEKGEIADLPVYELADIVQGLVDGLMEMCALEPGAINVEGCKTLINRMLLNTIAP